jgi:S1-C subfamily serine protease
MKEGEQPMSDFAWQFSESLAAVVEKTASGVVRISGRRRRGPSSGVLWPDGVIVTTHHVLEWEEDIEIGLPDGTMATAAVAGRDPATDLAALRISGAAPSTAGPAEWGDAKEVKAGNLVLSMSRPGPRIRPSLGMVGVVGEAWRTPIHTGFSGSALVDMRGSVIGVNTAGFFRGVASVIPTSTVRRVVESLLTHGQVQRGYLGIVTQPVRLPAALGEQLGQETALLLSSVQPGSPADHARLVLGDVLLAFDGAPLRHPGELLPLLEEEKIGHESTLKVLRGGEAREVRITVGARNGRE